MIKKLKYWGRYALPDPYPYAYGDIYIIWIAVLTGYLEVVSENSLRYDF